MPHDAIDSSLTGPPWANCVMHAPVYPWPRVQDRARLTAVRNARSPGSALHVLRHRLSAWLPIDVLITHYPTGTARSCSTSP